MTYCYTEIGGRETEIELREDEVQCAISQPGFLKTDFIYRYEDLVSVMLDKPDKHLCNMVWKFANGDKITIPNRSFNKDKSNKVVQQFDYQNDEYRLLLESLRDRLSERKLLNKVALSAGSAARSLGMLFFVVLVIMAVTMAAIGKLPLSVIGVLVFGLIVMLGVMGPTGGGNDYKFSNPPEEFLPGKAPS